MMPLPASLRVFERGWLSSNNVLLVDDTRTALVDTGYATHAAQTVALVRHALGARPLDLIVNTHLHSLMEPSSRDSICASAHSTGRFSARRATTRIR